jgi:hypothetical protein
VNRHQGRIPINDVQELTTLSIPWREKGTTEFSVVSDAATRLSDKTHPPLEEVNPLDMLRLVALMAPVLLNRTICPNRRLALITVLHGTYSQNTQKLSPYPQAHVHLKRMALIRLNRGAIFKNA